MIVKTNKKVYSNLTAEQRQLILEIVNNPQIAYNVCHDCGTIEATQVCTDFQQEFIEKAQKQIRSTCECLSVLLSNLKNM